MKQEFTHTPVTEPVKGKVQLPEGAPQKEKAPQPFMFLLVDHSHLDYAWYRRRSASKIREAELIDGIIDVVNSGQKAGFTIEQTVAAREYKDLRPERMHEFERLSENGKFEIIGTEIQQEIFLSGEEGFFWNVEVGHDQAAALGARPSEALYIPDTFGFPEQFAKMVKAAGYDNLIYTRGMGDEVKLLGAVFNWKSDDGSSIMAMPMPDGYGSANKLGRWTVKDGKHVDLADKPEEWPQAGVDTIQRILRKYGDRYRMIGLPHVLLGSGSDFEEIDVHMPWIIAHVQQEIQQDMPGAKFEFGKYEDYVRRVRETVRPEDLHTYTGEMRSAMEHPVLRGIDSARIPLKQAAEAAEREITKADTLLALSILRANYGSDTQYAHDTSLSRNTMYEVKRIILPVYSHDAISGCGTDDVYSDMFSRLDDVWDFSVQEKRRALSNLAGKKDNYSSKLRLEQEVSVVNTQAHSRTGVVEIPLEKIFPTADHVIALIGDEEIPAQVIEKGGKKYAAVAPTVEGFGAAHIRLQETQAPLKQEEEKKVPEMENEFYKVNVLPNGVVVVRNKETGVVSYANMFEDQGDRGEEYNFNPVEGTDAITTEKSKAKVTLINEGPVLSELQIDVNMPLPDALTADRKGRSGEMVSTPIRTVVRLTQGVDRIDFTTKLVNNAKDHRLRALFKTPNAGTAVKAKEPYGITERTAVPIQGGEHWREPLPVATSHNQGMVAAGDVAIFSRGLPEYEAFSNVDGKIDEVALTLLRSVGWLSREDLSTRKGGAGPYLEVTDAQCLGEHTFEYSMTMNGKDSADLIRRMNDFRFEMDAGPKGVDLADILKLTGEGFEVAALKPLRDGEGAMLRVYNPNKTESTVHVAGMFSIARRADAVFGMPLNDEDASSVRLRPGEILTLRLE